MMSKADLAVTDQESDARSRVSSILTSLVAKLDGPDIAETGIIPWAAPIPVFGDLSASRVATVGLNPSNREFTDQDGNELTGHERRFHTLQSLVLSSWSAVDAQHLRAIEGSCRNYFHGNPYNSWFKPLDGVISGTGASYYDDERSACHLDIIPYATRQKWGDLKAKQNVLLTLAGDSLATLLRASSVRLVVLNGQAVVDHFREMAGIDFSRLWMPRWSLPRKPGSSMEGIAYRARIDSIEDLPFNRDILVLGYNYNIQRTPGVSRQTVGAIRDWVQAEFAKMPA